MNSQISGILKASKKDIQTSQRCDKFKNIIAQGSKKHRIAFIDEIDKQQSLIQVHEVENWKIYNVEEPLQDAKQSCGCIII
ncbi:unnamed protein product (macronuclear) [Paramecium tetraurelia]|uniref:Guanine nucleotide-binding protein subunit gamma n=2 Tax=Paramecium TaxID=5884 RepID=A0D460_PARTE|nr:uncharacterized protein GSPATT00013293001 [Paramecium tetraurelia]CAD8158431.1 unnamed protein product [Paramecium octaurelia]CAK77827.1 unnamed protein product [Paramecium tetraurelia]|eukprot:XP_001445224.1 hypothetical protein (macronuclear) [Paramecium tetraurelia strain d4-2]